MTELQAFAVDGVVGVSVGLLCVWALGELGAGEGILMVAAMLTIAVPAFMVGVIGRHYERKEIERGEDPERR
jgi:ABC-type dipeptide/oligopeptide/nickel transport system permease component